jgi:UDP-N-acetylglucosamine acyltransferase
LISEFASVDPEASIASSVEIGPWTLVGPGVVIGEGTKIQSHCNIKGPTVIGSNNTIHSFCSVGDDPQDKKFSENCQESRLEIGDGNTIREYCSINRGTALGGGVTKVGSDNWIMSYCHIAHDCFIGSHCVLANNSTLGGHVQINDYVVLGGFTGVHQFCRLGESSFSAISTIIVKDVPPFVMVSGNTARARSINKVGMRRRGFDQETIECVKNCYRIMYRRSLTTNSALKELEKGVATNPAVAKIHRFVLESARGIVR